MTNETRIGGSEFHAFGGEKKGWSERFDNEFPKGTEFGVNTEKVKDFIQSELTAQLFHFLQQLAQLEEARPEFQSNEYDKGLQDMKDKVLEIINKRMRYGK